MAVPASVIVPLILAALPIAKELLTLIIEAAQDGEVGDISDERIDEILDRINENNSELQNLAAAIRSRRS